MLSFRRIAIVLLTALTLVSCRRDPNTAKRQYLESGNKYLDRSRYKEAAIQYQNAIKIDRLYGPAYYKLGLVYLNSKPANAGAAVRNFRRAVELLKDNQAYQEEYTQSMVKTAEILLVLSYKNKQDMEEVDRYCSELFKKDANSFDAFRLNGDLTFVRANLAQSTLGDTTSDGLYEAAMANYRKADAVKPGDAGVSMQMAMVLQQQKRYAEAEPYFRKAIDKDKTSFLSYMNLYRTYMLGSHQTEAENLLKEAVQNNPTNPQFLERLAFHYGIVGRRDDMLNVLKQIKTHAKEWDNVYHIVGDFYLRIGDADSALREYREGTLNDVKHKSAYQHSVIEVLMRQGKRAEAAEVNLQILKENPKDADARSLQATFLLDQGEVNTALTQLQAVVTGAPDNAVAHFQLGRAFLASGRPDSRESARQHFQKAIDLRPDMVLPRLGLAQLQVMHDEFDNALNSVNEILKADPNNMNARLIQSQALVGQKKYAESDGLLANIMKFNPGSPDVFYQKCMSDMAQNKLKEAEANCQHAYELNPNNPRGLLGVVDARIRQGQPDQAMALLQAEARKSPNRLDFQFLIGTTARNQGKFNDALASFTRVLNGQDKKSNARADIYLQIAETYRQMGDRDSAIANLQKAREILPESEPVLSSLGLVLDQAGKRSEARQAYEACLKVNPNNALILNNLAYLMAETNADLDQALSYAQKAKALQPNLAEISDTYGWILLKKNLPEQAIPLFRTLVDRVPAQSTYRFHLAMGYSQKGDATKAVEELREALKHSPTREEQQQIQQMLSKLGAK